MRIGKDLLLSAALIAAISALTSGPAHAFVAQNLPEPTTMSLIGAGIAGVIVAARLRRRK